MTLPDAAAVDLLQRMLEIPSLCGQEDDVAALLETVMGRAGFEASRDNAGNVIGTTGARTAEREIVILGHMDTVPGAVAVRQCDGKLYGRGAVDAKGPLATGLVAAIRAAARTRVRITVIGAVQEEGPSVGARNLLDRTPPSFLVIAEPSGWDAVVLGYKGSQRFEVSLSQPWAHTAGAEPTAPERLFDFWNRLVAWSESQSSGSGEFDRLTPRLIGMTSDVDGRNDQAALHVGMRLPPGVQLDDLRKALAALLPGATFDFQPGEVAVRAGKTGPLVPAFLRAIRAEGGAPRFKVKTGTSDMNVVGPVWSCPMLAYGPGDSRLDHTPDEHIVIDEYLRGIQVLTRVLEEI